MKATRDLTLTEMRKMLGISRSALGSFLLEEKIMLKNNGRYIPTDFYIANKYFKVSHTLVDKENFRAVVPIIRVTEKGFNYISGRIKSKSYSSTYFEAVKLLQDSVKKLGLSKRDFHNRVLIKLSDDRNEAEYILDFGTPQQLTFLGYNYREGKVWQKINT